MKFFFSSVIRYIRDAFNAIIDKQVEKGKIERNEFAPKIKVGVDERKQLLEKFTISQVSKGWRINSQTENSVTLEYGKKPNHILHFLLCFPTLGFWLIVWIIMGMSLTIKRKTWIVDEYGYVRQFFA
jgi:hypothetical protein